MGVVVKGFLCGCSIVSGGFLCEDVVHDGVLVKVFFTL